MLDLPAPKSPRRITWNSFSSFGVGFDIVDLVVVIATVVIVTIVIVTVVIVTALRLLRKQRHRTTQRNY